MGELYVDAVRELPRTVQNQLIDVGITLQGVAKASDCNE